MGQSWKAALGQGAQDAQMGTLGLAQAVSGECQRENCRGVISSRKKVEKDSPNWATPTAWFKLSNCAAQKRWRGEGVMLEVGD